MMDFLYVALGGFFGSISRYTLSVAYHKHPFGTWIANITGALLLAVLLRLYINDIISQTVWLFAGLGFSGAYTTFSTFSNEVLEFVINHQFKKAVLYAGSSFLTALLIAWIVLTI